MNMNILIGELLHAANSQPPFHWKREFYELKDYLLRRYGTVQEMDLQHIVKECYTCNGEKFLSETVLVFGEPHQIHTRACWKCGGTGIYEEFWIHLLRYQLGRYTFHIPGEKFYDRERAGWISGDEIEGYIQHQYPKFYLYAEAAYWLAFLFDWKLFFSKFGTCGYLSKRFTPMVVGANLVYKIRRIPRHVKKILWKISNGLKSIRQAFCRHDFGVNGDLWNCKKCQAHNPDPDLVPF